MKLFSSSKEYVNCKLCGKKESKKKAWKIEMNTSEGIHFIEVCTSCSQTLNELKDVFD